MKENESSPVQLSLSSVSWAWFHSGAIDLFACLALAFVGVYSLLYSPTMAGNISSTSLRTRFLFYVVLAVGNVIINSKITQLINRRFSKPRPPLDKIEKVSYISIFVIFGVGLILSEFAKNQSNLATLFMAIAILLVGVFNCIRVKYYYFLFIMVAICILIIRSLMGDNLVLLLPTVWGGVRYMIVGLLFGTIAIFRLVNFAKKYPIISA